MMDKIYYLCFRLSLIKFFRYFFILYYKCAAYCVSFFLIRKTYVKHAYLKGSFYRHHFSPVLSDLDFFIIGDKTEAHQKEIEKIFKYLHYAFPMVSDFDFYTEIESKLLFDFSGVKFFPGEKWKVLKGENVDFTYRFNPRKLSIDVIQEIFFQFEWLFKNIKKRNENTKYTTVCIQRQYLKVEALIKYIEEHEFSFYIEQTEFVEDEIWHTYTNEEIIEKFNKLIEENKLLGGILSIYESDFSNYDISRILEEEYYKRELDIITNNYKYRSKYLNLSFKNFKLFYYTGCIDSYLLFEWCKRSNDLVTKQYIEMSYYTKLIESKKCSRHDYSYLSINLDKILLLQTQIVEGYRTERIAGLNVFNRNFILIDVKAIGKDEQEYLVDLHEDWDVLGISYGKGGEKVESIISTVSITRDDYISDISNREHLLLLLAKWCFGARNLIILGENALPDKEGFASLKGLEKVYEKKIARLVYNRPSSIFLASWSLWSKINHFFYDNLCLKSDFFISTYLTSNLDRSFDIKELLEITGYNDGLSFELEEIQIPLKDAQREEKLLGYTSLLRKCLDVNEIGLLRIDPNMMHYWNRIREILSHDLDLYDELSKIDTLSRGELLNINHVEEWSLWGNAKIIYSNNRVVEFYTGEKCKRVILKTNTQMLDDDFLELSAEFQGEIEDEVVVVGVEEDSYYHSYDIATFVGNDLYDMNFEMEFFEKRFVKLRFEINVKPNKMYHFRLKNCFQTDKETKVTDFYRKIESISNKRKVYLGEFHRGLYKIVLKLKNNIYVEARIVDEEKGMTFKNYSSRGEDLVLFHFINQNLSSLFLFLEKISDNTEVECIDILKFN